MSVEKLKEQIKDYGRDIRLNLDSVLSADTSPGLTSQQLWGIALACAYTTKNAQVAAEILDAAVTAGLSPEAVEAAKAASTIMGMNNVYYRTMHLAEDKELSAMPAKLRMNVIGKPGIDKVDFELMSLAISAINGCGMCINAHVREARKASVTNEGIQSAIKIASVLNAAAQAISIS